MKCGKEKCPLLLIDLIPLTQGKYAIVDKEDYPRLSQWSWQHLKRKYTSYAACRKHRDEKEMHMMMHRYILNIEKKRGLFVDHINHNGLDNRKQNIRICSGSQNSMNLISRRGTSKYKGVSRQRALNKWQASIRINRKSVHLGMFLNEKNAAIAYNKAAKKHFGEYAYLNVME